MSSEVSDQCVGWRRSAKGWRAAGWTPGSWRKPGEQEEEEVTGQGRLFRSGMDQPKAAAIMGKGNLGQPRTSPLQLRRGPPFYMLQAFVGKAFIGITDPLLRLANCKMAIFPTRPGCC